jgi:hypothetical protein
MNNLIAGLIAFFIGNIAGSLLATIVYRARYPKSNKYLIFSMFFIGYIIFFYFLVK